MGTGPDQTGPLGNQSPLITLVRIFPIQFPGGSRNWLVEVNESSRIESLEAKGPVVKQLLGFGVGRDEDLKPAVEEEAIDDVGPTWLPSALEASRRRKGTLLERRRVAVARPARPRRWWWPCLEEGIGVEVRGAGEVGGGGSCGVWRWRRMRTWWGQRKRNVGRWEGESFGLIQRKSLWSRIVCFLIPANPWQTSN